jgi:plastocyanin
LAIEPANLYRVARLAEGVVMRTRVTLAIGVLLLGVLPGYAASLGGTVTIAAKPAGGAVVYLESTQDASPPPSPGQVVMDQRDLKFSPAVLPVVRGTQVRFTNSDDILHNVFSPSAAAGKFDLGLIDHGQTREVTLDTSGDVVVLCNIHMEMEAHILVLQNPYFATVAQDGGYRIPGVPAGTYTLRVWRKRLLPFTQALQVPTTDDLTIDLRLEK